MMRGMSYEPPTVPKPRRRLKSKSTHERENPRDKVKHRPWTEHLAERRAAKKWRARLRAKSR